MTEIHGAEAKRRVADMKKVGQDPRSWEVYYFDEDTKEYWVLAYPESHLQGGGEPVLKRVDELPKDL